MRKKRTMFCYGSIYKSILLRVSITLLLLLITQWLFYFLNADLFHLASFGEFFRAFVGSLRFALSACVVFLSPYLFLSLMPFSIRHRSGYRKVMNVFYYLGSCLLLFANSIDIIYYRFTLRRMSADIFSYLGVGGDFSQLIPQFLRDYWYIAMLFAVLIVLLVFFTKRIGFNPVLVKRTHLIDYLFCTLFLALSFLGWRGGFQLRPLSITHAAQYASSQNTALVFNTPFSIFRTLGKTGVEEKNYFTDTAKMQQLFNPIKQPHSIAVFDSLHSAAVLAKSNVVVIILESFSAEYSGIYNPNAPSYTPFLDSLAQHAWVFKGMANGKRSIDGIPATIASIPPLMNESYITSAYGSNQLQSFAGILKNEGYQTAFFHGGYNGSMGFDNFSKIVGFEHYFGMNEYPNKDDYDGNWGIFDLPYLQYMAKKLQTLGTPFAAAVFTLSSHHPYTLPKAFENQFNGGTLPIHRVVRYSDYALQEFFRTAVTMDWFHNTLFVITSDHTAQSIEPYYTSAVGMYEVPMIFYYPHMPAETHTHKIVQQIDVLPGIMDFLHYNKPFFSFGTSPFDTTAHERWHISYLNEEYQLIQGDYLLKFDGETVVGLYHIGSDFACKTDIKDKEPAKCDAMKLLTQSIIQQYNHRILTNQLSL